MLKLLFTLSFTLLLLAPTAQADESGYGAPETTPLNPDRQAELQAQFAAEAQQADKEQKHRGLPVELHGNWSCTIEPQVKVDCNTRSGAGNIRLIAARTSQPPSSGMGVNLEIGSHEEDGFFVANPARIQPNALVIAGQSFPKATLPRQVDEHDPAHLAQGRKLLDALANAHTAQLLTAGVDQKASPPLTMNVQGATFVRNQILQLLDQVPPPAASTGPEKRKSVN